jgi:hypothetical protein
MKVMLMRFLIGGVAVSAFSILGDLFRPKSFAGLFGAAPSIALATLGLTIASEGKSYAATEANSMMAGALAFFVYASCVSWTMMRARFAASWVAMAELTVWGAVAFVLWEVWLK